MTGIDRLEEKKQCLDDIFKQTGKIAVAYSSGVDSTFLLKTAHDALGDNVLAITAHSALFPGRDLTESQDFCKAEGIRHIVFYPDEMAIDGFCENPVNRCYICKKDLFSRILQIARENGFDQVAEGSNMDDLGDYRPGMKALQELKIMSPLREAGLTKAEIRRLSFDLGLKTYDKPSFACLASRFPYGETITREKLAMVEQAEELLMSHGFRQMRVRIHGMMARIELLPEDIPRMAEAELRCEIAEKMKAIGFTYTSLDLTGYRTGSLNESIMKNE